MIRCREKPLYDSDTFFSNPKNRIGLGILTVFWERESK